MIAPKIKLKLKSPLRAFILMSFLLGSVLSFGFIPRLSEPRYQLVYEFGPLLKGVPLQDIQTILIPVRFELLNSDESSSYLVVSPNLEDYILLRFINDDQNETPLSKAVVAKVIQRFKEEVDIFYRTQIFITQRIKDEYANSLSLIEELNQTIPEDQLLLIQDYKSKQSLIVLQRRVSNYETRIKNYETILMNIQSKTQEECVNFYVEDRWISLGISAIALLIIGTLLNGMIIYRLRKRSVSL
jgi:hypothetical protein